MKTKKVKLKSSPDVKAKFNSYPKVIKKKLLNLRQLIIETANESDTISEMEETLKWGEPSYLVKKGSTVRIDWKEKTPDQYAIYFKCTSKLVSTFKEVYGETFKYEKTRAILFQLDDEVPEDVLKECVGRALHYHTVKNLPQLGLIE